MKRFSTIKILAILLSLIPLCSKASDYDSFINKFFTSRPYTAQTHYFGTADSNEDAFEQSAISAISYGTTKPFSVGMHPYAYALTSKVTSVWAIAAETVVAPEVAAHLHGAEFALFARNGNCKDCKKYGLYVILGNRAAEKIEVPTQNYHNEGSSVLRIGAQAPVDGIRAGWQTIISLDSSALDRSVTKQYASLLDVTDTVLPQQFYLYVFPCLGTKCGLEVTGNGMIRVVKDIDGVPTTVQ